MSPAALAKLGVRLEAPGATPLADILRGVISDDELDALRERNAARLAAAQERLGERWLLARPRARRIANHITGRLE